MKSWKLFPIPFALAAVVAAACGSQSSEPPSSDDPEGTNPFLEDPMVGGKADTDYINPDGIEVEVDFEADVEAPSYKILEAPALVAQFALTYLRNNRKFYLESLAEDVTSKNRVEWLVDGNWLGADDVASVDPGTLRHFRIRGMNAVLLKEYLVRNAREGMVEKAIVPLRPHNILRDARGTCAESGHENDVDQGSYWFYWSPGEGCTAPVQDATVTVSKILPPPQIRYPEYDKLVEDGKVTVVMMFSKIDHGSLTENDPGFYTMRRTADWLKQAEFEQVDAPVGQRFVKPSGPNVMEIDLYSPRDFGGLSDRSNFANFQKAISEHEIVVFEGHSMLGASDFWSRPTYPDFYQIFIYGGCLGYEYYLRPILDGKKGWQKLDLMSSVETVSDRADEYALPLLASMHWAIGGAYSISWNDLIRRIRYRLNHSEFGVSGVKSNCFSPEGSLCTSEPEPADGGVEQPDAGVEPEGGAATDAGTPTDSGSPSGPARYENNTSTPVPDNDVNGVSSVINVDRTGTVTSVSLELDISHSYLADLYVTLSHAGKQSVVWSQGEGYDGLSGTFPLSEFAGTSMQGEWTLKIVDSQPQDDGTLNRWALVIQ